MLFICFGLVWFYFTGEEVGGGGGAGAHLIFECFCFGVFFFLFGGCWGEGLCVCICFPLLRIVSFCVTVLEIGQATVVSM